MRAKEFILEAGRGAAGNKNMAQDQVSSIPNAHFFPDLDNSSGYAAYRWGVAMAGMPDHPMDKEGPTGLKTVTIGYSDADDIIIDSTSKIFGAQKIRLTPRGSTEPKDTQTVSPTSNWNPRNNSSKKKKKK
jgi:hypothetical protein